MKKVISLIFLFSTTVLFASNDAGQAMPDQLEDNYYNYDAAKEEDSLMDKATVSDDETKLHFPGNSTGEYEGSDPHQRPKSEDFVTGQNLGDTYITHSDFEMVRNYSNSGKEDFSFAYIKDTFTYSDDRGGIFKQTFEASDSDSSVKGGLIYFSLNRYMWRSALLNFKLGTNFGLGFNQGKGRFIDVGDESRALISLWSLPVDFNLALDLNLTRFLKIQVAAGPSLMGLVQSRSDKEEKDKKKNITQFGTGYFYSGTLKISLYDIFPTTVGFRSLSLYDMSKLTLDFFMRGHNYSGFKTNDVKVSGTSIGAGFSFEFL